MFNGGMTMGPSLADIAAITNRQNDDGNGFNNGWWILILLMAMYGGFGGYGYGGYGNNGREATATQADIQRGFDTQAVISKLDGISNGLCDGFYAVNNGMQTGFNGIQMNMMQGNFGL